MKASYFKPRKSFSYSAHPFELGTFTGLWHNHDDNHFLLKIYKIDEKEYSDYYSYHLNYAIENNLESEEVYPLLIYVLNEKYSEAANEKGDAGSPFFNGYTPFNFCAER